MIKSDYSHLEPQLFIFKSELDDLCFEYRTWLTGNENVIQTTHKNRAELRVWLEENCSCFVIFIFTIQFDYVYFYSAEEAMAFKLVFGE